MQAELFVIADCPAGRLAMMPRPRAGDWLADELQSWQQAGLDVIVSVLDDDEITELDLADEARLCRETGLEFRRFPITDRGVPESIGATIEFVRSLVEALKNDHGVGIHCRMGVGRASLLAACTLVAQGMAVEDAWKAIARARGMAVPDTDEQRDWLTRFHKRLNGPGF